MRKNTIARKPVISTCPNGIYPLQKENSRSLTCRYTFLNFFVFLRDTASAFDSFGFIRVCTAEPRPDFRYRSNANDGKAMLCRVLTRGLAPNKKRTGKTCCFSNNICFLRDTDVSALNFVGFIRVCTAEPRPDFRCRSNANDGKAWLCRVLTRGLAPKRKQQVSNLLFSFWSGKRDSNSRHLPWQGNALPLSHSRILVGTIGLEPMTPCL